MSPHSKRGCAAPSTILNPTSNPDFSHVEGVCSWPQLIYQRLPRIHCTPRAASLNCVASGHVRKPVLPASRNLSQQIATVGRKSCWWRNNSVKHRPHQSGQRTSASARAPKWNREISSSKAKPEGNPPVSPAGKRAPNHLRWGEPKGAAPRAL